MCRLIEQQVAVELTARTQPRSLTASGLFCWQLPTSHRLALPLMGVLDVVLFFTMAQNRQAKITYSSQPSAYSAKGKGGNCQLGAGRCSAA